MLGVDETVKITYKKIPDIHADSGMIFKTNKDVHEYSLTVENLKNIDVNLMVNEQLPIPRNKEIKMNLIEPRYEKNTPELKKFSKKTIFGTKEKFERNYKLKPKEKLETLLKYEVEYPGNWKIECR